MAARETRSTGRFLAWMLESLIGACRCHGFEPSAYLSDESPDALSHLKISKRIEPFARPIILN
jgi:hypothetical protein